MSSMIAIPIPREIIYTTRMSAEELRSELAIRLFQQGKLSFGKAREMTGMTVWAFQQLLDRQDVPVHYDIPDYEEDLTNLNELGHL